MCQLSPSLPLLMTTTKTTHTTEIPPLGILAYHPCLPTLRGNSHRLHGRPGPDISRRLLSPCLLLDCRRPLPLTTLPPPPPAHHQLDHRPSSELLTRHHHSGRRQFSTPTHGHPPPPALHLRVRHHPSRGHHHHHPSRRHHHLHLKTYNTTLPHFLAAPEPCLLPKSHRLRHLLALSVVNHFYLLPSRTAHVLSGALYATTLFTPSAARTELALPT
jgi:hypothetical protein